MGQLTQNFVDLAMATCKEGRHPSLTVWEAQQLLHAWNDREALRARVAEARGLLDRATQFLRADVGIGSEYTLLSDIEDWLHPSAGAVPK